MKNILGSLKLILLGGDGVCKLQSLSKTKILQILLKEKKTTKQCQEVKKRIRNN